jgi:hypothetical protein
LGELNPGKSPINQEELEILMGMEEQLRVLSDLVTGYRESILRRLIVPPRPAKSKIVPIRARRRRDA